MSRTHYRPRLATILSLTMAMTGCTVLLKGVAPWVSRAHNGGMWQRGGGATGPAFLSLIAILATVAWVTSIAGASALAVLAPVFIAADRIIGRFFQRGSPCGTSNTRLRCDERDLGAAAWRHTGTDY